MKILLILSKKQLADTLSGFQEEKASMKCVICKHGEIHEGTATVTLERTNVTIVFKDVPAQVCTNCGEAYIDALVTQQLSLRAMESEAMARSPR